MHTLILGSGIAGVLAAYYLGKSGHQVEVIERQHEPAQECSFANGCQLSYSHAEPWANPYVFPKIFRWMFQEDAPLVMRFSTDPEMIRWGLQFLWNCRPSAAQRNCLTMLQLGLHSKDKMAEIIADTDIEFDRTQKGVLHLFASEKEFDHAKRQAEFQHHHGCVETALTVEQCVEMEPSLRHTQDSLVGGMHAPIDESGDIYQFTIALANYCREHFGTIFHFDTEIMELNAENNRISHVSTNRGNFRAEQFVVAMGAYSPLYLRRRLGLRIPIYPMKGYSITFPIGQTEMPEMSITDDARKIVYSRLGDRIRVAGTAEFAGYNTDVREQRIQPIVGGVKQLFPQANLEHYDVWACLRPSTPDGPPIIGGTPYENLYLNTGHGTLGWTQGAGSASLLAEIINNETPSIPVDGLTMKRYTN